MSAIEELIAIELEIETSLDFVENYVKPAKKELEQLFLDYAELTFRRKQFLEMDTELAKLRLQLAEAQEAVDGARKLIEADSEVRKDTGRDYSRHEAWLSAHHSGDGK